MNKDNTIILFGPPGTGKTYRLIQIVEHQMGKDVLPRKIAYLAFTKKAANEAIDRVRDKFRLPRASFPLFRTIHSFTFHQMSVQREQVVSPENLQQFGAEYAIDISGNYDYIEDDLESKSVGYKRGDRIMFIDGFARITGREVEDVMRDLELDHDLSSGEVRTIADSYRKWKSVHCLMDYTDMLQSYIDRGVPPDVDIVIVDEAQDLSPLQWQVIDKVATHARLVYLAGDDDQAIYRWAGADVDRFIDVPGTSRVLDQSYRVPVEVQSVANHVAERISHRRRKQWAPRDELGAVHRISSFPFIEREILKGGEWLILSRNKKFLKAFRHLSEPPRVRLSTIHAAKGGEADNIVVITDVTPRVLNWMQRKDGYEDECRVFYTALTRSRQNLYIMEPTTTRSFDI